MNFSALDWSIILLYLAASMGLIAGAAMLFIGRTGFVIRRLREMRLMTIPEFFERRYSRNLRVLTGVLVATGISIHAAGWQHMHDAVWRAMGPRGFDPFSSPQFNRAQVSLNRVANLFVSLFVMFWGLWYRLPGPAYFYLNITATIFLGGSFAGIVGGLYWKRANIAGGYAAISFLNWPASYAVAQSTGEVWEHM